jgi:hypothetical protein
MGLMVKLCRCRPVPGSLETNPKQTSHKDSFNAIYMVIQNQDLFSLE